MTVLGLSLTGPHYGATLLRVYEQRHDRQRYAFFAVWVTLAAIGLFLLSLSDAVLGSWLLTIYMTWSPWHFAGQNFGVGLMMLRRRGVVVDDEIKTPLHRSFVFAFLLAAVQVHMVGAMVAFPAGIDDGGGVIRLMPIGIPNNIALVCAAGLALAYLASLGTFIVRVRRRASLAALGPTLVVVATHALWFVIPAFGIATGAWGRLGLAFAAVWISAAHSFQYLWVTSYYAKRRGDAAGLPSYFAKAVLVSGLLALPTLLFGPRLLGDFAANVASVSVLSFAMVNLHHFVLDGAIWRMRDGRVAQVLLGSPSEDDGKGAPEHRYVRNVLLAVGGVALFGPHLVAWTTSAAGANTLSAFGVAHEPSQTSIGYEREQAGDVAGAIDAYVRALEEEPADGPLVRHTVTLLLAGPAPDAERALELARASVAAFEASGGDPDAYRALAKAARAAGDDATANEAARRARELRAAPR